MNKILFFSIFVCFLYGNIPAQENTNQSKFRQLKQELPTPNSYRTASGAPGHEYWQQKADYEISIVLDDENQRISGIETITYRNNSPDNLHYLWLQLDQNVRALESDSYKIKTDNTSSELSYYTIKQIHNRFDGGFTVEAVELPDGTKISHTINKTMMRIDLTEPLLPGDTYRFVIKWNYKINDRMKYGGRSGYEYFDKNDNYLYTIAQFYPRMAVYNDVEGWQNKQFLGQGEFALGFGDFDVKITVPADHIVAATGELQNPAEVLTPGQRKRLEKARKAQSPVLIVTQAEAEQNEKSKESNSKTWHFSAKNVRDFAFASSRKFVWDAMGVPFGDRTVMAMSFYPKEGNPLWEKYSTDIVAHTIKTYSKYTFDYPYPVAQSVHTRDIGMEYPMISFNGGRPYSDGTYYSFTENYMISVITHEVGHNFFPMIVNSDERQWAWMDEGMNTFLQYLTEQEWEENYPSWVSRPAQISSYMSGDKRFIMPLMTNSESIKQLGENAYYKPAVALMILRETIMGQEAFDHAFKQYANRWKFKHPMPADFFRTMEDASGIDLDWFWRGWFYSTDYVDISIDKVFVYQFEGDKNQHSKKRKDEKSSGIIALKSSMLDDDIKKSIEKKDKDISDFYYVKMIFSNQGGLVMPIILKFKYKDGTEEIKRLPVEVWLENEYEFGKVFVVDKPVAAITLDPYRETADAFTENNMWSADKQEDTENDVFKGTN